MRSFYTYGFEVLDESGIEGNTHCYISLSAPYSYTTPTSHRNVPLLAKWEYPCRKPALAPTNLDTQSSAMSCSSRNVPVRVWQCTKCGT